MGAEGMQAVKYTGMDTEFELEWQKSKDKEMTWFCEINSMFQTSVHGFFSWLVMPLQHGSRYWG